MRYINISFQSTYEELKLVREGVSYKQTLGFQSTYEELKPGTLEIDGVETTRFQSTYEELKLNETALQHDIKFFVFRVPMRN